MILLTKKPHKWRGHKKKKSRYENIDQLSEYYPVLGDIAP